MRLSPALRPSFGFDAACSTGFERIGIKVRDQHMLVACAAVRVFFAIDEDWVLFAKLLATTFSVGASSHQTLDARSRRFRLEICRWKRLNTRAARALL